MKYRYINEPEKVPYKLYYLTFLRNNSFYIVVSYNKNSFDLPRVKPSILGSSYADT